MTLTERDLNVITSARVIADTRDLTRPEWLKLRRSGLGGSDAAAVLGLSKWTSSYDLWRDKTGRAEPTDQSTLAQRRGAFLEPFIIAEAQTSDPNLSVSDAPYMLAHPDHPVLRANLDGIGHHNHQRTAGGVEAKNVHPFQVNDWSDGIPPYYETQVFHYLAVTGLSWWVVAADTGSDEIPLYYVEADPEFQHHLIESELAWWDRHVVNDVEPEVDGSKSATQALALIEARAGAVLTLDPIQVTEVEDAFRQLAHDNAAVAEAGESIDLIKNRLRQRMGEHTELVDHGGRTFATWRRAKPQVIPDLAGALTDAAFALGVPLVDLLAHHTTTKPGVRSLRTAPGLALVSKESD